MRATEHTSRALLLTGLPGVGKSTVVRHVAGAVHGLRVEGFITDEIRVHGRRVGFQLAPLRGNTRVLAHVDIESPHRVGRYGVDVRVVDEVVGKMMHRDDTADLYLIDEIGKMECFSRRFVSALEELLDRGRLGQGAWAAAKYGYGSPGTGWRRLHLAVDEGGRFVAAELTDNDMTDASVFPTLLGRSDGKIVRLTADGAYDRREVHDAAGGRGAYVVIPPRRSAVISRDPVLQTRNRHTKRVARVSRAQWRREKGQHRQARVENSFYHYKRIFGPALRARGSMAQRAEVMAACNLLNWMYSLGMPHSQKLAA